MRYICQLDYPHIPYHTNTAHPERPPEQRFRTVAQSGCGLCAASMVVDYLTDKEFCILDPSYTDGKFDTPERAGKVDTRNAPYLYCDVSVTDAERCVGESATYYLFSRNRKI